MHFVPLSLPYLRVELNGTKKKVRHLFIPSRAVGTTVAQYLRVGLHGTEGDLFFPKMHASAPFYAPADASRLETMRKRTAAL